MKFLIYCACFGLASASISDDDYALLPPIFHIDAYNGCELFCKLNVKLLASKGLNSSRTWTTIQATKTNANYYNHDELFHAICVQDFCPKLNVAINLDQALAQCYNEKYRNLDVIVNITQIDCKSHKEKFNIAKFDIFIMIVFVLYITFIIFATILDLFRIRGNKYLMACSVANNWKKIMNDYDKSRKLNSMQGIRFYTMILIIFFHTYSSYIGGYVENTKYLEDVPENPLRNTIRSLFVFLVQPFFLFSAWLLSSQMSDLFRENPEINLKLVLLKFVNRYFRIVPIIFFMINLTRSVWIHRIFDGPIMDIYLVSEHQRCRYNWWANFLFINNFLYSEMCYFTTWYLAADTQLYFISLIILTFTWKYKNRITSIIFLSFTFGVVLQIFVAYIYGLDVIFRVTPEYSKNDKYRCAEFHLNYSSTITNMATYMMGIGFGLIYSEYRNKTIFIGKVLKYFGLSRIIAFLTQFYKALIKCNLWKDPSLEHFLLVHPSGTLRMIYSKQMLRLKFTIIWWLCFLGPTSVAVILSNFNYVGIVQAVLSGILKPLFALGIGVGILGMSRKMGPFARWVCEWRLAVFLGNFTYSTYIIHHWWVFGRTIYADKPLYVSDLVLAISFVRDVIGSFIFGFLLYILVEMPALRLQKILVPQVQASSPKKKG